MAEYGHKIRVARPTGDSVEMYMVLDPRASDLAQVGADVKAVRLHGHAQGRQPSIQELHHFGQCGGCQVFKAGDMHIGYNHKMPVVVGIAIQDEKGVLTAQEDEIVSISSVLHRMAEYTAGTFGLG